MRSMTSKVWFIHKDIDGGVQIHLTTAKGKFAFPCPGFMGERILCGLIDGDQVTVYYDRDNNAVKVKAQQVYPGDTEPTGIIITGN